MTGPRDESQPRPTLGGANPKTSSATVRDLTAQHERDRKLMDEIRSMHEDELVDFIRDTVVRLDALADRLEVFTTKGTGNV